MDVVEMDLDEIEFRYATVNDAEILADIAVRAFAGVMVLCLLLVQRANRSCLWIKVTIL